MHFEVGTLYITLNTKTQTLFNFNVAFLVVDIDQSGALLSIPNLIINYQLFFLAGPEL